MKNIASDEDQVKTACKEFIQGRKDLKKGDSGTLKRVTEDSLYTLIMLHEQYAQMLDAPVIEADLNIYPKSAQVNDSCGTCMMSGFEYYQIELCKIEDSWRVIGENGKYATSEKIATARKKIADYIIFKQEAPAKDSVLLALSSFFEGVKVYFRTQETQALAETSDEATVGLVERLYEYAIKRNGRDMILEEMEKPNYMTFYVNFDEEGGVACQFYNEETKVNMVKRDNSYIVSGLNDLESELITGSVVNEAYISCLRALKIVRAEQYRNKDIF